MIKVVLFDFGGVLTEGGKKGFIQSTIAHMVGLPPEEVDIGDLHYMMRRGRGTDEQFFGEINQRYNVHLTKDQFIASTHDLSERAEPVYALAERLRAAGIRTGILSNVFSMSARDLEKRGFYDGFDPIILSCDEGHAKPDPELYQIAIDKSGCAADEILFVDDQDKCLPPAHAFGMLTVQSQSPEQVVRDVTKVIREQNNIDI